MKKITILIICIVCLSCGSKKKITNTLNEYESRIDSLERVKNLIVIDTFTVFKDRLIVDKIETEIEIPVECDSLGIIKNLRFSAGSGAWRTIVSIKNNKLFIETAVDSIVQVYEKEYRYKYKKDSISLVAKIKEELKYVEVNETKTTKKGLPWWLIIIIIGGSIFIYIRSRLKRNAPIWPF
jgi:DNA-directed RNA polymerase subunit N (RpoN/RPB10)